MKAMARLFIYGILSALSFGQTQDKIEWGEKFNSHGATLVLREVGRSRIKNQTVVTYNAYAFGLPKDVDVHLVDQASGQRTAGRG
jgi:hypothetical protein